MNKPLRAGRNDKAIILKIYFEHRDATLLLMRRLLIYVRDNAAEAVWMRAREEWGRVLYPAYDTVWMVNGENFEKWGRELGSNLSQEELLSDRPPEEQSKLLLSEERGNMRDLQLKIASAESAAMKNEEKIRDLQNSLFLLESLLKVSGKEKEKEKDRQAGSVIKLSLAASKEIEKHCIEEIKLLREIEKILQEESKMGM